MDKVERDGRVAVLVSPGYGAGWSTWADDPEAAVFAPDVVAWVERGKPDDGSVDAFAEKYGYTGGLPSVEIEWVAKGERFTIDEYDGSEGLTIIEPQYGYTA